MFTHKAQKNESKLKPDQSNAEINQRINPQNQTQIKMLLFTTRSRPIHFTFTSFQQTFSHLAAASNKNIISEKQELLRTHNTNVSLQKKKKKEKPAPEHNTLCDICSALFSLLFIPLRSDERHNEIIRPLIYRSETKEEEKNIWQSRRQPWLNEKLVFMLDSRPLK